MNYKYNKKVFDFLASSGNPEVKALGGARRATARLAGKRRGRAGRNARRVLLNARFDPNARDADNDGLVQEMTRWERPAGPRRAVNKPFQTVARDNEETDLDALLADLNQRRQNQRPQRLMGGDEPDSPKPRMPGQRPGQRRPQSDKPVTYENYRGPKTILPMGDGDPMSTVIRGLTRDDWNEMVANIRTYFSDMSETLDPKSDKLRSLYQLVAALKNVKARDGENGLELDGTDLYFKRIGKSLKAIKEQGNDFPNLDKISVAMKEAISSKKKKPIANRYSLKISTRTEQKFEDVGELDAKGAMEAVNRVEQKVLSKFGKINSKRDALNALNAAHPDIDKNFHFLRKDLNGPLSPGERGLVIGYLHMLIEQPELRNYKITFRGEKDPNKGGSAGIIVPWNKADKKPYSKTMVRISYRLSRNPFERMDDSGKPSGTRYTDTISNQGMLSYVKNNPENLPDRELIAKAEFMGQIFTALHESAHVRNSTQSLADAVGDGGDGRALMKKIFDTVDEKGMREITERVTVANEFVELFNRTPAQKAYIDNLLPALDEIIEENIAEFRKQGITNLDRRSMDMLEGMAFMSLMFKNDDLTQVTDPNDLVPSPFAQMWDDLFPNAPLLLELPTGQMVLRPVVRQNLDDIKDELDKKIAAVNTVLSNDRASHREVIQMIRLSSVERQHKLQSIFEKFVVNDYDSAQRVIEAVYNELTPGSGYRDLLRETEQAASRTSYGFAYVLTENLMDKLTEGEVNSLRSLGKSLSRYAGKTSNSFYGYSNKGFPVEVVAELRAALEAGKLPRKGTPEYAAAKKLMTWMYGPGFWNEIEDRYGN